MRSQKPTASFAGMACFTLAIFVLILQLFASPTAAQTARKETKSTIQIGGAAPGNIPLKQILADPRIISTTPGCEVTGFTISFLPAGANLFGPFKTSGNTIKENQVNFLREFTNKKVRIFVEAITTTCEGKEIKEQSIVVTSIP